MLRRVLLFALLAWGVLTVPLLCSGGVLEHACVCEVSSSCSHEESCSADPCVIAKPTNENATMTQSLTPISVLLTYPVAECAPPDASRSTNLVIRAVPPALRFGARPLLI